MLRPLWLRRIAGGRSVWSAALCGAMAMGGSAFAQPPADRPNPALVNKVNDLIDEILEAETEFTVTLRRSKLVRTKYDILRIAVADPGTVEIVAFGSREIEVIGRQTGSTSMTVWLSDGEQTRILSLLVSVKADALIEDQRRMEAAELQQMVNEMFPNSKVQLIPVADKLIVKGEARDAEEASRLMAVLRQRGSAGGGGLGQTTDVLGGGAAASPYGPNAGDVTAGTSIISLLEIPGEQQVLLKVRIAELKRSAIRRIGARFNFTAGDLFFNSLIGGSGAFFASQTFDDGSFQLFVEALASNGYAKILAEPNLITLSGRPATFLAGGEFAVPTVVGVGGVQAVSTSFKGFGTSLSFTPTVLDKDRIRLQVVPTFSTINPANTVQGIFGLDTRTTSTTVDMREGQSLAIAGLIQEQQRGDKSRVPWAGDLPIVGVLFSSQSVTRDETELVVMVTPELVHPMEPDQVPPLLPGMEVTEPDDVEFYLYRRTEGDPNCHHRSTVWANYRDRRCNGTPKCHLNSNNYYLSGPHGFSE